MKKNISICELCGFLPHIIDSQNLRNIDDEWREIRYIDFKSINVNETTAIDEFWENIYNIKSVDGSIAFPLVKQLILTVLSIPIATANVERTFSQINLNKTKIRNKLEPETLTGILLTKDYMKKHNKNCISFEHSNAMLKKMTAKMYEKK